MPPILPYNSTGPVGGAVGLPAATVGALTPAAVQALQSQVGAADPSLASQALGLLRTPLSAVSEGLHLLSLPGQFIRQEALGAPSASQFFANHGWNTGGGELNQILRGAAAFTVDAGTDPTTYLTAGLGGVGSGAAKEMLLSSGLDAAQAAGWDAAKAAGTSATDFATSQAEGSVARAMGEAVHGTPSYARALQNVKDMLPGLAADTGQTPAEIAQAFKESLPTKISGGLRFHVPFTNTEVPVVPAEVTGKVTAPLGEAIKGSGLYGTLADNFSKFHALSAAAQAAGQGAEGAFTKSAERTASAAERGANQAAADLRTQIDTAFGADAKGRALAHAALVDPTRLPEALAAKGATDLTAAQAEILPKVRTYLDNLHASGVRAFGEQAATPLENYFPRAATPEAIQALKGGAEGNPLGKILQGSIPGAFEPRDPALAGLSFADAQAVASKGLPEGVKAFKEDPAAVLYSSSKDVNRAIAAKNLADTLAAKHLLGSVGDTATGISKMELDKVGLTANEARLLPSSDPRIQMLSESTQKGIAQQKALDMAQSAAKMPKAAANLTKSETLLGRLQGSALKKQSVVEAAVAKGAPKADIKVAQADLKVTTSAIARQQAVYDSRQLAKTNLEGGMKSSGDGWPIVPGPTPPGWRSISLATPGIFNGKVAPDWLATEIENGLAKNKASELGTALDTFTNSFKRLVTVAVPLPNFWLKRAVAGGFVNYLGGASLAEHAAGPALYHLLNDAAAHAADGSLLPEAAAQVFAGHTAGELVQQMEQAQVLKSGVTYAGDILDTTLSQARKGESLSFLHQPGLGSHTLASATHALQAPGAKILRAIDDSARITGFLHGLNMSGGDAEAARQLVMQLHGSFGELTPFEANVMKRVIPFYTWLRVKTPLILQSALEQPGKVVNSDRFIQDMFGNPQATQQAYANGTMPQAEAVKGGFIAGGVMGPLLNALGIKNPVALGSDLPTYSLNNETSRSGILGSVNPLIGQVLGILEHTQTYPGQVQPMKVMAPVRGPSMWLGKALEHIPLLSSLVARAPGGELRMNSTLAGVLNNLPTSSATALGEALWGLVPGMGKPGGPSTVVSSLKYLTPFTGTEITPQLEGGQLAGEKANLNALVSELYARGEKANYKAAVKQFPNPKAATGATLKMPKMPTIPKLRKVTVP